MDFNTPACWYEGVYRDKARVVSAARPFMICNNNSFAVLLIHGYAGYPGELVRPAIDIAECGFDVIVHAYLEWEVVERISCHLLERIGLRL